MPCNRTESRQGAGQSRRLVALNGQEAAFLAGGEFPIPVPQAFGLVTIQFKKFGVGLVFTPNIMDRKHISLSVAPEVSELDFPECLDERKDSSFRRSRRDGPRRRSSWPMDRALPSAGSCGTTCEKRSINIPVLGDIPILGALFRSTSFQKNETELLIIVTRASGEAIGHDGADIADGLLRGTE